MSWPLFVGIVALFSIGAAKSHPVSFDGESRSQIQGGNEALSQSQLFQSPRLLRRAEDSVAIPTSSRDQEPSDKEGFSTSASNNIAGDRRQYAESSSNAIIEDLKGLNLLADLSGETNLTTRAGNSTFEKPSDHSNSSSSPGPSSVASVSSESRASTSPPKATRQYISGDVMLDKIMNLIKWRWQAICSSSSAWRQLAILGLVPQRKQLIKCYGGTPIWPGRVSVKV